MNVIIRSRAVVIGFSRRLQTTLSGVIKARKAKGCRESLARGLQGK